MALRAEEILQIKFELGVSVTLIGAEPYITYLAIFDKAIQPYIIDPTTTSSTAVTAAAVPTAVQLTVASIPVVAATNLPAFTVGTQVNVDVGPNAENPQILAISGNSIWVTLCNAHGQNSQPYPVTMAGGEFQVRQILQRINFITQQLGSLAVVTAGVEEADKNRFYASTPSGSRRGSRDKYETLVAQREQARNDLGEAVGFPNLRAVRLSAGSRMEAY